MWPEGQWEVTWKGDITQSPDRQTSRLYERIRLRANPLKIANIGFFAPKPYLKGVDRDFLFDRKFCLVEILKRLAWRLEKRIFHNIEKRENH